MNRAIQQLILGGLACAGAYAIAKAASRRNEFSYEGQVVLITGGSRGLGLVMARQLAVQGAWVAICARDPEELERARSELVRHTEHVLALQCDVTNSAEITRLVAAVTQQWGRIDVLINNAGTIQVGPLEVMEIDDYQHAIDVHFWGPLTAMLEVLPQMRRRGSGRIVNIASIGGKVSVPHLTPYCASKFALVGLSQGMHAELLPSGIHVTTVCPGLMRTGSHVNANFKGQHEQEFAWFSAGASGPVVSMNAERAASQILEACRHGRAHIVLSLPAKLVAAAHGLFPGAVLGCLTLVNQLLPSGKDASATFRGSESRPAWLPSWLTYLGDKAAERNNELLPSPRSELNGQAK